MIVAQHSAEPLRELDAALGLRVRPADKSVADALMAALVVVVLLNSSIARSSDR
jgi:hypothetical protein